MESILNKELTQLRKDYGDLLITTTETQHQLESLRTECQTLRTTLHSTTHQNQELKLEYELRISNLKTELNMLKKERIELSEEVGRLEAAKAETEIELVELKKECVKEKERMRGERERNGSKYDTLLYRYNAVMEAATVRFNGVSDRLLKLEKDVEGLQKGFDCSGLQQVDATHLCQEQENNRKVPKSHRPIGSQLCYETTPNVERAASSMPGSKPANATHVDLGSSDEDA